MKGFKLAPGHSGVGAAHEKESVDRKMRVHREGLGQAMPLDEPHHFEPLIFRFVSNTRKRHHRGLIACRLEHTAQQNRHIGEAHSGARLHVRNHLVAEISIRAAEIEMEFNAHITHHHVSP